LVPSVLTFACLGKALEKARKQKGFHKLTNRLKQVSDFYAAAFEVEVAASYVERDWEIEFIEEGHNRSSDLKVTREDGFVFWAECKCRDILTERDKNIQAFWTELESSLMRELNRHKINVAIVVQSLNDPVRSEIEPLKNVLLGAVQTGGVGDVNTATGEINLDLDPSKKYGIAVRILAAKDAEIPQGIDIGYSNFDRVLTTGEIRSDRLADWQFTGWQASKWITRNPIVLAFKNSKLSDKVAGIIHGFKSAVGQLPQEGPGVIWIRIPDNMWMDSIDRSFEQAKALLEPELKGSYNRRVTAIILMTRVFQNLKKGDFPGLAYKPLRLVLKHENPRRVIP
jgi:hypothetical protein